MINRMQLVQMVNGGGNPMQMLMQAAPQNPLVGQVLQMTNGKTPGQMRDMAQRIAQQRGVDLDQFAQQMGIKLPRLNSFSRRLQRR